MGDKEERPVSLVPVMTRGLCTVDVWIRVSWKGTYSDGRRVTAFLPYPDYPDYPGGAWVS